MKKLKGEFYRLVKVFADGGYRGELIDDVKNNLNFLLEVVLITDKEEKFKILPKRWIVERTFSWFESYRRLSKDFEYHTKISEVIVQLAMLKLMLNRLEK
nr:transposase [Flavobacterium cellulosilyticum]